MRQRAYRRLDRERIGALQLLDAVQLGRDAGAMARGLHRIGLVLGAFVDRRGDAGHRGQVVAALAALHLGRQRAAHGQPHHHLGAFVAAQPRVVGQRHVRQLLGIVLEQVEEALVPDGVVEAGALAVNLVRQPAGRHDRHPQVFRVALDGAAQRLPELVEAPRARHRQLQHAAHLQRHQLHRPARPVRAQHRQRREAAMVERLVLEERHVELVGHQRAADMRGQRRVPLDRRQGARAAALVGHFPSRADAERERRVMVEEERGGVIVVDHQQHVGPLFLDPGRERREVLEDRRPDGIVALVLVEGETNRRSVGGGDAANDSGHTRFR